MSQPPQDVEIIDLTEVTLNGTITIEDSPSPSLSPSSTLTPNPTPSHSPSNSLPNYLSNSPSCSPPSKSQPVSVTPRSKKQEAKRLKVKQKEEDKLQKEANRRNAAGKALLNCTANIDRQILKIIEDPEELTLKTLFDESAVQYRLTEDQKIENSVSWTYKHFKVDNGACVPQFRDADWILVVMQGDEYLKKLLAGSITGYLESVRNRSNCDVILFVHNLANHLKSERAKEAKNYRKTFKNMFENAPQDYQEAQSSVTSITVTGLQESRLMLEMELKRKYPNWKLHIDFHEKTLGLIQALVRYTSSLAKLEVKQKVRKSIGIDWAINMDKEKAVDPTKSSEELTKLWVTQLQQFPQITLPIAKAIAAEYPSPCALIDQYKSLTTSEGENLLAELYVQRNLRRQIGPKISKRIYCFMTCRDPDVHIGLN